MSGDILDIIDGALDDWTTSGDAMRWSPDPFTCRHEETVTEAMICGPETRICVDCGHSWEITRDEEDA